MFTSYSAADLTNPLSSARIAIDAAVAAVIADKLGRPSNKVTVTGVTITSSQRLLGQLQQQQQAQSPQQQHRQLHSLHVIPSARHLAGSSTTVSIQTSLLPYGGANNLPQGLLSSLLQSNASFPSSGTSNGAVAPVFALQGVTSTTLLPLCGNGVCESGERPGSAGASGSTACAADCPFPVLNCPTVNGNVCNNAGVCVSATGSSAVTVNGFNGMCNCWILQGYTGDACGTCAAGFTQLSPSSSSSSTSTGVTCIRLEARNRTLSPTGTIDNPTPGCWTVKWIVIVGAGGGVLLLVVAPLLTYVTCRRVLRSRRLAAHFRSAQWKEAHTSAPAPAVARTQGGAGAAVGGWVLGPGDGSMDGNASVDGAAAGECDPVASVAVAAIVRRCDDWR